MDGKVVKPEMSVVAVLTKTETQQPVLLDELPDPDDPEYELDVHLVPVTVTPLPNDLEEVTFGIHEFKRNCCCRPEIRESVWGRNLIKHSNRVN